MIHYFERLVRALSVVAVVMLVSPSVVIANEASAYAFEAIYNTDYWSNLDGGISEDEAYLTMLDLTMEIDAGVAYGWEGGSIFGYLLSTNSETLSENIVGDAQTVSNIDNGHVVRLMELWYEQAFGDDQSLKFGLYDLNSEFDAIEAAGLFINSSHGIGPDYSQSGENGPSIFPVSSLSLRYFQNLTEQFSYQVAVLDAVPADPDDADKNTINLSSDEGALLALEMNYQTERQRFGLGTWYYTKKTEELDGASQKNNMGLYGIVEHKFLTADTGAGNLTGYLRAGVAEESVNQFDNYIGGGLVFSDFSNSRPNDSIGFAIARAHNGDDYRDLFAAGGGDLDSSETNFELTYRAVISERLVVQVDIQFIKNPGTDPQLDDALVVGLRMEIALY